MPYVRVATNVAMDKERANGVGRGVSRLAAEKLGKGEEWVMVEVLPGSVLLYGGTADLAAFVEFKSVGLSADGCPGLSEAVCGFLAAELSIPPNRVYIEFADLDRAMFGFNSKTLG